MNIEAEKLELVKLILETNSPTLLKALKQILKKESVDEVWEDLPQYQKDEIKKGLDEIAKGDVVDYEAFIRKHRLT